MPDQIPDSERTLADREQTLADREQTLADTEQTLSDTDQTSSDSDQTSADTDQRAADCDQEASDRDLGAGVDRTTHDATRDIRRRSARAREHTADARLDAATARDATADGHDLTAAARDSAADARDRAMTQRDATYEQDLVDGGMDDVNLVIRAAGQREVAAQHRADAAEQRVLAAKDRQGAEQDREQAGRERVQALTDREALTDQLALAATDPLTGARSRAAGLTELEREVDRALRTGCSLVAVYVDVVGLKSLNDTEGHGAGDQLLKRVVTVLRNHLRTYDLVVRLGGDEFLCAISKLSLVDARRRFSAVEVALTTAPHKTPIRTGFAELAPGETVRELIARADSAMLDANPS